MQGAKSQHMTPRTTINACKIYKQMRKKSDKEQGKTKHSKTQSNSSYKLPGFLNIFLLSTNFTLGPDANHKNKYLKNLASQFSS